MAFSARRARLALALVALLPVVAAAQDPTTVRGRVTAENAATLPGVAIAIPELGLGAITRDDGTYSISIPAGRVSGQSVTLTARRVGYRPKSARITLGSGATTQDFALEANPLQLGEMVITGAGTTTEVEKLGSVRNTVQAELIQKSNEANIVTALSGKAPNVQITTTSGDPGASAAIRIRGLRTLSGTGQPLFVVDGVPVDNSAQSTTAFNVVDEPANAESEGATFPNRAIDINPNDIENIEILKGPARLNRMIPFNAGPIVGPVQKFTLGESAQCGREDWRKRVGVEPTKNRLAALSGFEGQPPHRERFPSTSDHSPECAACHAPGGGPYCSSFCGTTRRRSPRRTVTP